MKKEESMPVGLYKFIVRYLKGNFVMTTRLVSGLLGLGVSVLVYILFLHESQLSLIALLARLPQFHGEDIRVFILLVAPIVGGLLIGHIIGYIKHRQNIVLVQEQLLCEVIQKKNAVIQSLKESSAEYDLEQKEQRENTVSLLSSAQQTLELQLHKTNTV